MRFSPRRREDSYDEDLTPEQIAALSEQERLLHQEAAGKAAAARLKAAKKAERQRKSGGGGGGGGASSSSSSSAAAAGGGGGGEEEEEEEEDDDEDYEGAAGARKRKQATEGRGGSPAGEKRTKVQGGTVPVGRKGKEPEDIYTKLLKEKRAAEIKVSGQEAIVERARHELEEQCAKDESVSKVLKAMRDQLVPKSMGAKEGIDKINSFIVALQVRSDACPADAILLLLPVLTTMLQTHARPLPRRPGASTSPPPLAWTRPVRCLRLPTAPTTPPWQRRPLPSAPRAWAPAPGSSCQTLHKDGLVKAEP